MQRGRNVRKQCTGSSLEQRRLALADLAAVGLDVANVAKSLREFARAANGEACARAGRPLLCLYSVWAAPPAHRGQVSKWALCTWPPFLDQFFMLFLMD